MYPPGPSRLRRFQTTLILASLLTGMAHLPAAPETPAERDARMAWWREARFGMFIHWGLYSLAAGEWEGKAVAGHGEWIMNKASIPVDDYAKLAPRFNPVEFDADTWVKLARDAGMKYLVITAKHHDGFALFPSDASTFDIRDATPFPRDPIAELAAACRQHGLKFGVYYSHSQDWHHRGGNGNSWDPSQNGDYDTYLDQVAVPQVKELLTRYGPLAILWYDTPRHMDEERGRKFLPLHALQPGLIINNRLLTADPRDGSTTGDTETPEQFVPPNGFPGRDWETCMTMNDSWGFKKDDHNWKSADELIRNLSDITSKGGNFLLNVGPTASGTIPEPSVERLRAVGQWLARNGHAIHGTRAGPFPRRLPWGRTTRKGNTLFLHVWDWPADGKLLLPGVHQLPRDGSAVDTPDGIVVTLPDDPPDRPVAIVALEFSQPVTTTQELPGAGEDGWIRLTPDDAELKGGTIDDGVAKLVTGWDLRFSFTTAAAGLWRVRAEVSPSAYNRIQVSAPGPFGRSVTTAVQAWGNGPGDFLAADLGVLPLDAGVHSLTIKSEMDDLRPLQIRKVWLSPIPDAP